MNHFQRLIVVYLRPHLAKLIVILTAAMVTSCSWFTVSYLRKVMVDDVLQVRVGQGTQELASSEPRLVDRLLRDGGRRTRDGGSFRRRDTGRDAGGGLPISRKTEKLRLLWWIFLAYVGFRIFFAALNWGYTYGIAHIGQELVFLLRQ